MKLISILPPIIWIGIGIALIIVIPLILIFIYGLPNIQFSTTGNGNPSQIPSVATLISVFGGILSLIKTLLELRSTSDKIELEYDGLVKYDYFSKYPQMDQPLGEYYYLKIKKANGKDVAKSVRGFMTIHGTEIVMLPLQWHLEKSSQMNISDFHYLWLFAIDTYHKELSDYSHFTIPHTSNVVSLNFGGHWKYYKDKTVEIKIQSENAKTPSNSFKETTNNIFLNAKPMNQ